ncbi:MAG: hypothetical protein JWR80_2639 [Bradyrhizobium sp.]|nr:hypothetical protein [Bradyrhizobium sp.]
MTQPFRRQSHNSWIAAFEGLRAGRITRCLRSISVLLIGVAWLALGASAQAQAPVPKAGVAVTDQQMAEYRRKLAEFEAAQQNFNAQANPYWTMIADKRKSRNAKRSTGQAIMLDDYVLTQPPQYTGPGKPVDPSLVVTAVPPKAIPVVADFLLNAQQQFQFVPTRPATEIDFKKAYVRVASAAGLTKDQAVRIYAFESGGNGKYDVQAGLEFDRPGAKAISTALGYNQLLTTNSVELLAEQGDQFLTTLGNRAAQMTGPQKAALERKIAILQTMVDFTRTVADEWSLHEQLGITPKGLGIHALNLDVDVGPLLQTQKLMNSVIFARRKRHTAPLTAAELEMMNLTGDGNGFDMVSMPQDFRPKVPTSNFFSRGGYERNSIARKNNVVSALLSGTDAKMDQEVLLRGARDMAAAF